MAEIEAAGGGGVSTTRGEAAARRRRGGLGRGSPDGPPRGGLGRDPQVPPGPELARRRAEEILADRAGDGSPYGGGVRAGVLAMLAALGMAVSAAPGPLRVLAAGEVDRGEDWHELGRPGAAA